MSLAAIPQGWRPALAAIVVAVFGLLLAYQQSALAMVMIWHRSETFAHGFVVPPIVAWLIWRQRHELARLRPAPSLRYLPLLAAAALAWGVGELVAVNALTQLMTVAMLVLLVPTILGTQVAATLAFPLGFLFFAVPIGDFVMPQLMDWTARFTVFALRLTGIPVYQEGLQFVIPSGRWSVIEACSGVRYLIASLTVGTLYAYLTYVSPWRRLAFVAVSIIVPIIANWVRAYMIVMLGHLSGNTLAVGVDHLIYGWVFFGVVILLMFMVGGRWTDIDPDPAPVPPDTAALATPGAPAAAFALPLLLAALTVILPQLGVRAVERGNSGAVPQLDFPTAAIPGWTQLAAPPVKWHPAWINPSAEKMVWFERDGRVVGVYLGYYRNQSYGSKLVSSENVLVRSQDPDWAQVASGVRETQVAGRTLPLRRAELRSGSVDVGGQRLIAWRWYWVNGQPRVGEASTKAYSAWVQMTGGGDDSAVVILVARADSGVDTDAQLAAFLDAAGPAIEAALARTRSQR